jgi:hypothetical protein
MTKKIGEPAKVWQMFRELLREPEQPFPHARQPLDAPTARGVYVIFDPQGRVVHVGMTTSFVA